MIKYLLLIFLPLSLYASKVLSYNIYERSDRADVMITFDTPFHGTIKQNKSTNQIIIKLQDATIESTKIKNVNSDFLHTLKIKPFKNKIYVYASISPDVKLIASKTADAYGLRLRFTHKSSVKSSPVEESSTKTALSSLPTKKETEISTNYIIVVSLLLIGIILLFILKKKIITAQTKKGKESWLFNSTTEKEKSHKEPQQEIPYQSKLPDSNVSIRFQKSLDNTNSVVMLDFGDESYLILMGNSNILLDKFKENKPTSEQEFDSILQERNQELENFLGSSVKNSIEKEKIQPLQAYKERAASLIYNEE